MICMKKWERFTKEEIEQFAKESTSYAQLANKVGYGHVNGGSAIRTVHDMVEELSIDTSHFKGQGWKRDNFDYSRFRYGNKIKSSEALYAIAAIRGNKCECCGLTEWRGQPIALEVHHIDGQDLNSDLNNLQLLCPNCHSLTDNYKGRNINSGLMKISDECFVNALNNSPNIRQALLSIGLTAKGDNYSRAYELIHKYQIEKFLQAASLNDQS